MTLKIFKPIMVLSFLMILPLSGCLGARRGNVGNLPTFVFKNVEAEWIRNGEPIEFENKLWYPQDNVDILLDSEVILMGEYKGVQFFIEKLDVRPYNRLFTKFGRNKFRVFEERNKYDRG